MRKIRQHGFTLVELISVLVILAILLSIALPALTNLSKASAINAAAREVSNTLSLARQYAITHRTTTRVVFPYNSSPLTYQYMWYHSYSVMALDRSASPAAWKYVTKWEYLPTGAVFLHDLIPPIIPDGALDDPNSLKNALSLPFPDTLPSHNGTLAYIEFTPTGAVTPAGTTTTTTLRIQEGFINSTYLPQPTPGVPVNIRTFVVDSIVGHIQVIAP
jgi:prepilin-type N-terminal cleavage/methylation domain-containing protein